MMGLDPELFPDPASGFGQEGNRELEVALALQRGQPGDERFVDLLVEEYGADIYRLIYAVLDVEGGRQTSSKKIFHLVEEALAFAVDHLDQFWGKASPRLWLWAMALKRARQFMFRQKIRRILWKPAPSQEESEQPCSASAPGTAVDTLPEEQRAALILCYLFDLDIEEIAGLMSAAEQRVADNLATARKLLLESAAREPQQLNEQYAQSHPHTQTRPGSPANDGHDHEQARNRQPRECQDNRSYSEEMQRLDAGLTEALAQRWPLQPLTPEQRRKISKSAKAKLGRRDPVQALAKPLQKSASIAVFVAILAGIGWTIYQSGLLASEYPAISPTPSPAPTTISPPRPGEIPASATVIDGESVSRRSPDFVSSRSPDLSADGRWLVFEHSEDIQGGRVQDKRPKILLYDRIEDQFVDINALSGAPGWGSSPSVSGDGRWIVFVSSGAPNEKANCLSSGEVGSCPGIFLHDRESGLTEQIDRGFDGAASDGESFSPRISENGRWIAFWSAADDLVPEDDYTCEEKGYAGTDTCANVDLFVYDRQREDTIRIPVGRRKGEMIEAFDIASNGRFVALTISREDRVAQTLEVLDLKHFLDVYVYDLHSEEYQPVNYSQEGVPGNRFSYGPSLSADGRFLAFASQASNLVPGDTIKSDDVFVRDLIQDSIERLTLPNSSRDWDEVRFLPWPPFAMVVNISSHGGLLAFASSGHQPDGEPGSGCEPSSSPDCNNIYVVDRQSGEIQRLASSPKGRHYDSLSVSADGRWVAYLEIIGDCDPETVPQTCGEIWLYDRQADWLYAVTKGKFPSPDPE